MERSKELCRKKLLGSLVPPDDHGSPSQSHDCLASGVICFFASTTLKRALGYDDSLDVFGVHCIGGIVGAMLTGIFCAEVFGGAGFGVESGTIVGQLGAQGLGVLTTLVYTSVVTFIILKVVDLIMGLRVSDEEESIGLDLALHNETGYNL